MIQPYLTSIRRAVIVVSVLWAMGACAAAMPSTAHAVDFSVKPCLGSYNGWSGPPTYPASSSLWTFNYECPNWIWIGAIAPVSGSAEWNYPTSLDPGRQIKTFTAKVLGDPSAGDIRYSMKACTNLMGECDGPTLPYVQEYEYDPTLSVKFNAADHPQPNGETFKFIRIEARCDRPAGEACEPPQLISCDDPSDPSCMYPEFGIYGMNMAMADTTKPVAANALNIQTDALQPSTWISDTRYLRVHATDVGSGVLYMQMSALFTSTNWRITRETECGPAATSNFNAFCTTSWDPVIKVDPTKSPWKQGQNWIRATAYDMGRNPSTNYDVTFFVDTYGPNPSPNLRAGGPPPALAGGDWVSQPQSPIEWDALTQDYGSPYTDAQLTLDLKDDPDDQPIVLELPGDPRPPLSHEVKWPSSGKWNVAVRIRDKAGNLGAPSEITVPVDFIKPDRLLPELPHWIGSSALEQGQKVTWQPPANLGEQASGVCSYRMGIDKSASFAGGDQSEIDPKSTEGLLPSGLEEGDWFVHLWAQSCAGLTGSVADVGFAVDLTAPEAQTDVEDRKWLGPAEEFTIRANDAGGSGVERIEYLDNGSASSVVGDWAKPALGEGIHQIAYRAIDGAGNSSPAQSFSVGIDRSGPVGRIERRAPGSPARVTATAEDSLSGVSEAELQFRPEAGGDWRRIGDPVSAGPEGLAAVTISAAFPDTDVSDGAYSLRMVAIDRMGNRSEIVNETGGAAARIVTPVREQPVIAFGVKQQVKCRRKTARKSCPPRSLVGRFLTRPGRGARVSGSLTLADGRPLAGQKVEIVETNEYSRKERRVSVVTSGADGGFSAFVPAGMNRSISARFAGSDFHRPAAGPRLNLLTPARLTLRVNDRTPRTGQQMIFSGRLLLGEAKLTELGQPVDIQYRSGDSWRPLGEGRALPDGSYEIPYSVPPFDRPLRLTVRAIVKRAALFPYETGKSRSKTVVVRP